MQLNLKARDWHNWVSAILVVPMLLVGLTTIFLAHKKELGLNELDLTRAVAWLPLMGADMARVLKDVKRLFYTTAGTPRLAGELALELAARRGIELGPVSPRTLMAAFDRLGGRGYGIVGEALLQSSGLGYLYPRPEGPVKLHERIRGLVRDWLSARIRLEGGLTG